MNSFRFGDAVAIVIFVAAIVFSIFMIKKSSGGKKSLVVSCCGDEYVYPMEKDGRYELRGSVGISVIAVENGSAWFEDSPCPNKNCVQSGKISEPGSWAACLPNDVFIRIDSDDASDIDALAY